ncbi:hypothetical protein VYU27_007153 [Nannochloropsis oceanica]
MRTGIMSDTAEEGEEGGQSRSCSNGNLDTPLNDSITSKNMPIHDSQPATTMRRIPSLVLPEEAIFGTSTAPPSDCAECRLLHQQHHRHQHQQHQNQHHQQQFQSAEGGRRGGESGQTVLSQPFGGGGGGGGGGNGGPRLPSPKNMFNKKRFTFLSGGSKEGGKDKAAETEYKVKGRAAPGHLPSLLQTHASSAFSLVTPPIVPSPSPHQITKPHRIILVRHGESTGNADERVYVQTPDWKVPLSPVGHEQARETGRQLKALIGDEPLYIYTSPYRRTKQTLSDMLESLEDNLKVGIREEPRITEQQFGNFQCHQLVQQAKKDRSNFGRFYFRFPNGESGLDVYTRVTSFISTMFRDFADGHICRPDLNIIIVTHGLTLRLLLMRWFKLTVETFESTTNPPNGSLVVMTRKEGPAGGRSGGGVYEMAPESAALISLSCDSVPVGASLNTPCSFDDSRGGVEEGECDRESARPLSASIQSLSIAK